MNLKIPIFQIKKTFLYAAINDSNYSWGFEI